MTVDPRSFKDGMRQLAAGVTVITTAHGTTRAGLTATAVCSVSAEPPRLLVCINQSASAHEALIASGVFCVNVLALTHQDVAGRFASPTVRGEARFEGSEWTSLFSGAPVLADARVAFDCRIAETLTNGSHTVIIGDVVGVHHGPSAPPLLYMDGGFSTLALSA